MSTCSFTDQFKNFNFHNNSNIFQICLNKCLLFLYTICVPMNVLFKCCFKYKIKNFETLGQAWCLRKTLDRDVHRQRLWAEWRLKSRGGGAPLSLLVGTSLVHSSSCQPPNEILLLYRLALYILPNYSIWFVILYYNISTFCLNLALYI